jgi:ethanolamine utilization protein EutN
MYDDLGAGVGSRVAFSESGEAAAPFYPEKKPIDAYCACLIDSLQLTEKGT